MTASRSSSVAARVFLIFALGYFLSYLVRGVNLPLGPLLAGELDLSPAQLGLLTSFYLMAFAACQLPLGVLLDRFGPRRVQGGLLLLAAAGALVSAAAEGFVALMVGRLLLGIGTSGCLMAGLKAIVQWFPADRLPVLNGLIYAIGGLGAVTTGAPIAWSLDLLSWRGLFVAIAVLIASASLLLWFAVPARSPGEPAPGTGPKPIALSAAMGAVGEILRDARFWRVVPLTMLSQAAYMAVQGLWAGPYMRDVEQMSPGEVASMVTLMGWAMVVGAALFGWLARGLERRGLSLEASAGLGMAIFIVAQIVIVLDVPLSAAVRWIFYGLAGTTGILCYASLTRQFRPELAGRVSTALNLLVFAAAFLLQYGFGLILDAWPHEAAAYAPAAHHLAWWLTIAAQTLALVWYVYAGRRAPGGAAG